MQKTIKLYKENTPIEIIIQWFKTKMYEFGGKIRNPSDRILIIRAKTGSGKSTALPVEIFRIFKPKSTTEYTGSHILVTQPRVLTAQEIAKDIASSPDWASDMVLGENIGYSTGSGKLMAKGGGLLYATIGTLLQQLRSTDAKDTIMKLYKFIILDEVHERSMEFDMTVMLMKKYINENYSNKKCPFLILTSATFDVEKYCKYFDVSPKTNVMDVMGSVYPISESYLKTDSSNTVKTGIEIIKDIHEERINPMPEGENDILVFCPGMMMMKEYKTELLKYSIELIKNKKKLFVITIIDGKAVAFNTIERRIVGMNYSDLRINDSGEYDSKGQHKVMRRIILGTNVAETGLTIMTLGHCIDTGWKNIKELYQPYGIEGVIQKPVDKSNVIQRRGRVGRKFPGHFYALYTEETFNSLADIQLSNIVLEDIGNTIIDILIQQNNCFAIDKIDMLDNPPVDNLKSAIEKNIVLGYIKSDYGKCFLMSELGEMYKEISKTSIEIFRSIIAGYIYDVCITDLITISAMLDVRMRKVDVSSILKESLPAFFFKTDSYMDIYTGITMDDFITGLFIFEAFTKITERGIKKTEEWCEKNKLDLNTMIDVIQRRLEIMNEIAVLKLDPFYNKDKSIINSKKDNYFKNVCNIKQCIFDGFKLNIIHNDKLTRSYKNRFGQTIKVNIPNRDIGFPQYLVTNKISINSNPMNPIFTFNLIAERVSVIDGYIGIDTEFLTPIQSLTYEDKKGAITISKSISKENSNIIENYNQIIANSFKPTLLALSNPKYKEYLDLIN